MPMCSILSAGCASTTTKGLSGRERRILRARPLQPACFDRSRARLLDKVDPEAARRARHHYWLLRSFRQGDRDLRMGAGFGMAPTCEDAVVKELVALRRRKSIISSATARWRRTPTFARNKTPSSSATRRSITAHVSARRFLLEPARHPHDGDAGRAGTASQQTAGTSAKIIVWAHNSHLGDARATQMGDCGELNLGQLVRERFGNRRRIDRLHHLCWHSHRGVRLGCTCRTQEGARGLSRKLRRALPRSRHAALLAQPAQITDGSPRNSAPERWSAPSA